MGKQIEEAMLHIVHRHLANQGITKVHAVYKPTAKNQPVIDFIRPKYNHSEDGLLVPSCITAPPHIRIVEEEA
jgi:predicted enzyme involved in methoxymalonyl-ACP biosynthesis